MQTAPQTRNTTLSLPDDLFERMAIGAVKRRITKSELMARALEAYLAADDTE